MSQKLLFLVLILSTLGLIAFVFGTLIRARPRYWKRYGGPTVSSKPPFNRWWLRKYAVVLSVAAGVYLLAVVGTIYMNQRGRPTPKAHRYATDIGTKTEEQKKLYKSYVELSAAVEKNPNDAATHLKLARAQRDLGMAQKALATYQKVLYLDPKSLDAHFEMGRLAAAMGETNLAALQVTEMTSMWPRRPELHLLQAQIDLRAGKSDQAIEQWRIALEKDPGSKEARVLLISTSLKQRSYGEAARLAEVGLKLTPDDTELSLLLARSLVGLGRIPEAQATLLTAAGRDVSSPVPVLMLGDLQVSRGEYLAAIKSYEEVLLRVPDHVLAMNNIAQLTADHGYELDRAATLASRLYAKYPKDPAVVDTLGWVLFKQGKLEEALPLLQFAAVGAPNNPAHRYHYGTALLKEGQTAAGLKELEAALKISKDFDGADKARALLGGKR